MSLSARFANRSILAATLALATAGAYAVTAVADGENDRASDQQSSSSSSQSQLDMQRGGGPSTQTANPTPPAQPGQMPAAPRADGQIAQVVMAINAGEIAEARLAATRATDARVRQFATRMQTEHQSAGQQLRQVLRQAQITAQPSDLSRFLSTHAQQELAALRGQHGAAFDSMYITAQVTAHQQALQLLGTMIPTVTNPALRQALDANLRPAITAHLQHAQMLQSQLQQGGVQPSGDMQHDMQHPRQ